MIRQHEMQATGCREYCRQTAKLYIFHIVSHWSSSVEFRITGYDPSRLWNAGCQDIIAYPVMCPFPLSVVVCDRNPPMLQTETIAGIICGTNVPQLIYGFMDHTSMPLKPHLY